TGGNLTVNQAGGLVLAAAGDFVQFSTAHTRRINSMFHTMFMGSDWEWLNSFSFAVLTTKSVGGTPLLFAIEPLHNGATLTQVNVIFAVANTHSGVPVNLPSLSVWRFLSDGQTEALSSLNFGTTVFTPTPASG